VLDRTDAPDIYLLLDESVLHRPLGGVEVMAEQLHRLLAVMRRPNVHVRVVPFGNGALVAMLGPFLICDLGDEENAVLYRESLLLDEVVHTGEAQMRHRMYFEHLWHASLSELETAHLMAARADQMVASPIRDITAE
jgi:hypothetical protein